MCGRYILAQAAKLERAMQLGRIRWQFDVSYNVAPTQPVPVVRFADGEREGLMMRWGMIPFFAKGIAPRLPNINATVENLETAPTWRGPWSRAQRCILPAAGFYEWHLNAAGEKHPYFIHVADQDVFGFAGLWDRSFTAAGSVVESCALVTVPGNDLMRQIHNTGANPFRMPAILAHTDHDAWLSGSMEEAKAALQPYPQEMLVAHQVSTRVNSAKNNDEKLIEPAT
jgi:putative SOS response-associated peptidase YedK